MMLRDLFRRWLLLAALLALPPGGLPAASTLVLADGICRADEGAGHDPRKNAPHRHDDCGLCQLGIGPALLSAVPPAPLPRGFGRATLPSVPAPASHVARLLAYASRAPPAPVGA